MRKGFALGKFFWRRKIMRIFNTLSRKMEEFVPQVEGEVKMYACGPTVYNLIHIGNARPIITSPYYS